MSQFSEFSDEELSRRIIHTGGVIQQALIAELNRRQQVRTNEQILSVHAEVSKTRADLDGIRERLKSLEGLEVLEKTHRVHLKILWIAIVTAILAAIAALDAILGWIRGG